MIQNNSSNPFGEFKKDVLHQLREQNYMESTLTSYTRIYNRVTTFMWINDAPVYTEEIGEQFLNSVNRNPSYVCAIWRLNDSPLAGHIKVITKGL